MHAPKLQRLGGVLVRLALGAIHPEETASRVRQEAEPTNEGLLKSHFASPSRTSLAVKRAMQSPKLTGRCSTAHGHRSKMRVSISDRTEREGQRSYVCGAPGRSRASRPPAAPWSRSSAQRSWGSSQSHCRKRGAQQNCKVNAKPDRNTHIIESSRRSISLSENSMRQPAIPHHHRYQNATRTGKQCQDAPRQSLSQEQVAHDRPLRFTSLSTNGGYIELASAAKQKMPSVSRLQ